MPALSTSSSRLRKPARVPRVLARVFIRPPVRASEGAQNLNAQLGAASKLSRLNPVPRQYRYVINWGNTAPLQTGPDVRVINPPAALATAINKLSALSAMQAAGVRIPEFTTVPPVDARCTWLARGVLTGSGGDGITVVRKGEAFPAAPLYTKYVKKKDEVRMHVAFGRVICAQFKKRLSDNEQTPDQKLIRNYDNGWVFCPRDVTELSQDARDTAVAAVAAVGLDFGAVDVVFDLDTSLAYVLEVNTAPGLQSPTLLEAYRQAFTQELGL